MVRQFLEEAALEECDSTMRVQLSPDEWHLVGMLCGRLRITPGQWFLGCAAYNGNVAENEMDRMLASLPTGG